MKIILLLILFTGINYAQDESITKLLPGKWKMNFDNAEVFEEWKLVNESELIGTSYSIENGEIILSENLYLKKFADQWAYVAIPKNQSIALFALVEQTHNKFIFENNEHDFPQRIIYEFQKDGKLTVSIEGNVDGELKRKEFSFNLVIE